MSFNVNTVNTVEPTKDGNIPLDVPKALGSTDTYSPSDTLVFNGTSSEWNASALSSSDVTELAMFGQGHANDYANSGLSLAVGNTLGFYDPSPYNTFVTGAITFNKIAGTDWLESITLATGAYEVYIQADVNYSALGYIGFHLVDESDTPLHQIALSGAALPSTYGHPTAVSHVIEIASPTTVRVRLNNVLNVATSQGNAVSERCFMIFRRT